MTEKSQQRFCTGCGTELSGQESYCPECGMSVDRASKGDCCKRCGEVVSQTLLKCPHCGNDPQIEYMNFFGVVSYIGLFSIICSFILGSLSYISYIAGPSSITIIIQIFSLPALLLFLIGFVSFLIGGSQIIRGLWNNENPVWGRHLHPTNYNFNFPVPQWLPDWGTEERKDPNDSVWETLSRI